MLQNKKDLSERDICTKFITPAVDRAGCREAEATILPNARAPQSTSRPATIPAAL